jgi:hypothetical protein
MKRKVRHATRTPTRLRRAPMSPNAIAISASADTDENLESVVMKDELQW